MSVRRLAEDQVQPVNFAFNEANTMWADATIKKYPEGREQSAVIPLLMRAQEQDGWVTRAAIEKIADMLGMAYIRVLEVATFYTQFQLKPVGTRAHIQVCGTTPCMLRGSEDLMDVCKRKIHHDPLHLNAEGTLSWEEVECQGACVNAPMVIIFKDAYEDLTPDKLEQIIDKFEAGKGDEIRPGPQIDRHFSAPIGELTSLKDDTALPETRDVASAGATEQTVSETPSNAARANTDAPETDPSLKSPTEAKPVLVEEKPVDRPSLEDANRPAGIAKPETPDDLKTISDVDEAIEGSLHELGIFTFAQIASWSEAQREWVDIYLDLNGRIGREEWLKQAGALAKGGEAEYIQVFGKKPR